MVLKIAGKYYMGKLAGDGNIKLYVKCAVQETGQSYATQDVVELRKPKLVVTVRKGLRGIAWPVESCFLLACELLVNTAAYHD